MSLPQVSFTPSRVLTTTEAREAAPGLAQRFRDEGLGAEIVFFGPHRRPDAAIVPAALLEALAPYLEDIVTAHSVRQRRAEDDGTRLTLAEFDERHGFAADAISREVAVMRQELGLPRR